VADRVVAGPGTKAYGALSVGVQTVARARRLFRVGRGAFRPVPGVDSAILRITPWRPERIDADEEARLRIVVRAAFQWRRKQMRKILRDHPDLGYPDAVLARALGAAGIGPRDRPERVSPEAFVALTRALP
ncbi:MAG: 16S rRNA (adenine(1518)-N(6)/adenine(1519)-N(6))-dimethyltransferase, partial [Gemmatimonadetes bacterium]|nr:16S rRNA (adenine(1518)-N(6)/adenine(1519)-N(6))-dimethyltransferase [Gemmatimonadota bacterium]NIQ53111.1 16S rRNA (adenine(1518)-N(6)/adenine(1519)-N(6))-dimethyltransferase [Gemmatimonadota bacterium]NIU73257.1 16S rRNA (adenine(1518)-N(6)/adenine(1519)-N(6))-dimethyltransferase [Gammaproteobacteria bacterium]NIX43520.1 16S rRNA (adenine(1518)-N(6)/adenine(1519)-N(6))-dimethyltransferase [Gemmatimonadota bacterium]NIY07699.1 16S rRNA (adenine(1518)-N(6)/adenine(1519)-N(6))-dimethyltransfe